MPEKTLLDRLWESYEKGELTDLNIEFDGTIYKAHKLVVCNQSKFFKAACMGLFKESKSNTINLDNDTELDAKQIECLLRFMYKGEYCTLKDPDVFKASTGRRNKKLTLADIPEMNAALANYDARVECETRHKPKVAVDADGNSLPIKFHAQMYAIADRYDVHGLSSYAMDKWTRTEYDTDSLLDCLAVVYTSTPESDKILRAAAAGRVKARYFDMSDREKERLKEILSEVPDLALDVFDIFETEKMVKRALPVGEDTDATDIGLWRSAKARKQVRDAIDRSMNRG